MQYLSENAIRERVIETASKKAAALKRPLDMQVVNKHIETCLKLHRQNGTLITHQQYIDLQAGRTLRVGDHAMYVGPTRAEATNTGRFERCTGQLGMVTGAEDGVITWHPTGTDTPVDLVIRVGTPGYYTLERVPLGGT